MDYNDIKNLLTDISNSDITHLKLEVGDVKIEVDRSSKTYVEIEPTNIHKEVVKTTEIIEEVVEEIIEDKSLNGTKVLSPIVGTYYKASSPNSEPFVKVGQKVKKGDVIFIIEAMKVINEITAEVDGEVLEILVEDNEFVEFNEHIMTIG